MTTRALVQQMLDALDTIAAHGSQNAECASREMRRAVDAARAALGEGND